MHKPKWYQVNNLLNSKNLTDLQQPQKNRKCKFLFHYNKKNPI